MNICMKDGLPIVSFSLSYQQKSIHLPYVLFDTGCAATVFDTDLLTSVGLDIDFINGQTKRMYGVGGTSEACYEQLVSHIQIDSILLSTFRIQLGSIQETYGFDGILGVDFMLQTGLRVDFESMRINYSQQNPDRNSIQ